VIAFLSQVKPFNDKNLWQYIGDRSVEANPLTGQRDWISPRVCPLLPLNAEEELAHKRNARVTVINNVANARIAEANAEALAGTITEVVRVQRVNEVGAWQRQEMTIVDVSLMPRWELEISQQVRERREAIDKWHQKRSDCYSSRSAWSHCSCCS